MGAIVAFLGVRGTVAAGIALAFAIWGGVSWVGWSWEKSDRLKAEAALAIKTTANEIMQEQIKLYQDREQIKAWAGKKRGKLRDLETQGDVDGLVDQLNHPDGVRRTVPANPSGGAATAPRYHDPQSPGVEYQEAPGR